MVKNFTHMRQFIFSAIQEISSLLLPNYCILCRLHLAKDGICSACELELPWQTHCCSQCAEPMTSNQRCGRCLTQQFAYDKILTPFRYEEQIKYLITRFKFHEKLYCANLFAALMLKYISQQNDFQKPDLLLPVPLHTKRIQERGFNQALEVAKILSKHLQIPLYRKSLKKILPTLPQSSQHYAERQKNLRDVFVFHGSLQNQHIALIDDVVTTGATANELAKLLKRCGAKRVTVLAIARTKG